MDLSRTGANQPNAGCGQQRGLVFRGRRRLCARRRDARLWIAAVPGGQVWAGRSNPELTCRGGLQHRTVYVLWVLDVGGLLRPARQDARERPADRKPVADSNGDWYFGADDGYVHDVEMPASGSQLFQAAKFGPGGQIQSSPVEAGCSTGPCMYFGSSTSGAYFVLLGKTRVSDLRACISAT